MWLASLIQVYAIGFADPLATSLPLVPAASAAARSGAPTPLYWRQTLFSIPFHVDKPATAAQEAVEVQLHVSGDRGAHWDSWLKAKPDRKYFLFKAGVDGEYWFDVRTLDRSGQLRPLGACVAKLVVIVDTQPPKVQLDVLRGAAGQITAKFRIDELYPNLQSLAVEYRLGATAPWLPVSVGQSDIRTSGTEHVGEVTWLPPNASGTLEIRLRLTDLAGNPAESHAQVILPANAAMVPATVAPAIGGLAIGPPGNGILANATSGTATLGTAALGTAPIKIPNPQVGATTLPSTESRVSAQPGTTPWPAENATSPSQIKVNENQNRGTVAFRVNGPVGNQFGADPASAMPASPFRDFSTGRPPPVQATPVAAAPANTAFTPPPGVTLRWVNTRVFQLEYDPQAVGPSGIAKAELWGTRDGGKSWQGYGNDPEGRSPMLVTVPDDGIYGFRMAIQNREGRGGQPPQSGEKPDIWIGIDLTRPIGRITSTRQGMGPEADKLVITWEASDNHQLASQPISLSYSGRRGGPWTQIVGGLENSGRFLWAINPSLPQQIFLRLEIRDAAGNMGIYESTDPTALDLINPGAQLRDLKPMSRADVLDPVPWR